MQKIEARDFTAKTAWAAMDIADIEGATVRLHWTDQPYVWHVNEGEEVFVVLDGSVAMKFRDASGEHEVPLMPGDIFHAENGDEHLAVPNGVARILVIEKRGSV
ncbi:cupin domain-containing protein [Phaeovulum sp.]|uniref:cupin domain-containing protein n=1 Tax=Phaeovulum sp. TaxID=2934796 RepID=UPI003561F7DE